MAESVEVLDSRMKAVLREDSRPRCIAEGFRFTEGPAWWPAKGWLIFSDIPDDTAYCWTEEQGHRVWRRPSEAGLCLPRERFRWRKPQNG